MVREVRVHDDDEGAGGVGEPVHVGGAEAEFSGARFEDDVRGAVELLELLGDGEGAVGGGVVDDDDFVVEGAVGGGGGEVSEGPSWREGKGRRRRSWVGRGRGEGGSGEEWRGGLLLGEGLVEEPDDDGEVAALVVGWEDDGVFLLGGDGRGGFAFRRHGVGSVESWTVSKECVCSSTWSRSGMRMGRMRTVLHVFSVELVLKTGGATREQASWH